MQNLPHILLRIMFIPTAMLRYNIRFYAFNKRDARHDRNCNKKASLCHYLNKINIRKHIAPLR